MTTFSDLGLSKGILKSIEAQGYETPTPIQEQAIPLVLEGHDLMGLAQTGTGKTAAFGLPLIHNLLEQDQKPKPKSARSLILAPTRELVNQIADNIRHYVRKTPLWVSLVIGGQSINSQAKHLARGTDILVATPGRLLDLVRRGAVRLDDVNFLVLDEADQMLDLGFIHALKEIATLVGTPRQTLMFSATMPKQVESLSRAYQTDPVKVEVAPAGKAADKVNQGVHFVSARAKTDLLKECLTQRANDLSLVFHRTKHGAEKLKDHLVDCGFEADSIHGNKSQGQRDRAIKALKKGDVRILVATDVAARGIDIPGISHVYNYNLPEVPENYVHRIGRTARAGESGEAIAFCSPDEFHMLKAIEKLMGIKIRVDSGDEPDASFGKSSKKTRGKSRRKPSGDSFGQRREFKPRDQDFEAKDRSERPSRPRRNEQSDRTDRTDRKPRREFAERSDSRPHNDRVRESDRFEHKPRKERVRDDYRSPKAKKRDVDQEAGDFIKKISRDQTDALGKDKPRSKPRSERGGRDRNASDTYKPKKFKNKQMSVTDFDNREKERKERRENPNAGPDQKRKFEGAGKRDGNQPKSRNSRPNSRNKSGENGNKGQSFRNKNGNRSKSRELSS